MKKISVLLIISMLAGIFSFGAYAAEPNIIQNSKMDKISGWSGVGGGTLSIDASQDASGERGASLKVDFSSGNFYDVLTNVSMEIGTTYTVSFDAKGSEEGIRILPIRFFNNGYAYLPKQTVSTRWEHYSFEWTQPDVNSSGAKINGGGTFALRIQDMGTVWIDNVKIVDASYIPEDPGAEKPDYYEPYYHEEEPRGQTLESFSDASGHWAEETLSILKTEKAIRGVDGEHFEPNRSITRAEFLTLLMSQLNIEDNPYKYTYADVAEGEWYSPKIANAKEIGLISPLLTADGCFHPNDAVTREDACVMAESFADYSGFENTREKPSFSDDGAISDYARDSVYGAYEKNIMSGFEDGSFRPKNRLTRAEAAQLLLGVIERSGRIAVFVDPDRGSDAADGTKAHPLKSISKAQSIVHDESKNMHHNIYVLIKKGEHFTDKAIELTAQDSGKNGCSVIFTSYGGGKAIISGGRHIKTDWQLDNAEKGIYKTYVGTDIKSRQMFVDGVRMIRARTLSGFQAADSRINDDETGYVTSDTYFAGYRNIRDMELVYYQEWTNPRCGVDRLIKNGNGTITLTMENPCWGFLMNKEHLKVSMPVYFENQYEFIDEEGEWYLDNAGWLYFKPFEYMNLSAADIVLPVTESLLTVTGSTSERAENIVFVNLGFKYAGWMRPSTGAGYSDAQGGRIRENGDKVPDAAVWIKYMKNLTVKDCEFSKMGITAMNVTDWIENADIIGNHMYDLSAAGMYIGNHGENGGASGDAFLSKNITVKNNLVHDYGIDYGSSDGIEGMTMSYADFSHNEIYNGRYSGLTLGYGAAGTKYAIDYMYNYVHDVLNDKIFDGGSIYVTKETSGTEERRNRIAYNYTSRQGNWSANLYTDNASTYWEVAHNVTNQKDKPMWDKDGSVKPTETLFYMCNGRIGNYIHDNYVTTLHNDVSAMYLTDEGPVAVLENNYEYPNADWPEEAQKIIDESGLEKEYDEKYPSGIEVVDLKSADISIQPGKSVNIKDYITALGRKEQVMDLSPLYLTYATDREDIISVADDGTVTSVGTGDAKLVITIVNGDMMYQKTAKIHSGDSFERLRFKKEEVQLYTGSETDIVPTAVSSLGTELKADSVSYESANPSVAAVSADGKVKAAAAGETEITVKAEWRGEKQTRTIPVTVKNKADSEEFSLSNYLVTNWDNAVTDNSFWVPGLTGDKAVTDESGTTFSTPANTVASANTYGDELLHTKIRINAEGGWPSMCLRVKNQYETYGTNTSYMVFFNQGSINVQKFVLGKRRVFESGAGAKCNFEYNKEYDLMIGAVNHDDNVEIIVCLDGEPVMRFRDYDEDRITDEGYVQMYARSGSISLLKTK